ncbi:MAG: ABC transporter substrate-binding protein, partial [Bacteroidetes bacterium]|nr:ABC transporter substrate-binding protein [Bacteroidota bacterium]
ALDWTPNVNHIGFLISKTLGYYEAAGIKLEILNPQDDNYALTPGKKLELDKTDFAIAPTETVISLNNKRNKVEAVAVYTILQEDLSRIASLRSSKIDSPEQLDGNIYASYNARYEDHIVREMVKNAGGKGDFKIINPEKLGIWNTLLQGKADATWIFDNWEGVEAETQNIELKKFKLEDYNIPYGYSPIVLTTRKKLKANQHLYSKFIEATKKGFLYTKENLQESKEILQNHVTSHDLENIDLIKSIKWTLPYFGDELNCGKMNSYKVKTFLEWLVKHKLEQENILDQKLFTNELFN